VDRIFVAVNRASGVVLRFTLGTVLLWIGALHIADPTPVRQLLMGSLSGLAFNGFVYALGAFEVVAAALLFTGLWARYVGLLLLVLFGGTLTIFIVAPAITYGSAGFPHLSLTGQFLLKDLVLAAASLAVISANASHSLQPRRVHTEPRHSTRQEHPQ
jgi:hypothetical protein